jgi:hypothetical protein
VPVASSRLKPSTVLWVAESKIARGQVFSRNRAYAAGTVNAGSVTLPEGN